MTGADGIIDPDGAAYALGGFSLVVAMIGCGFIAVACICVLRFPARSATDAAAMPAVTLLKPLKGAEPDLAKRLRAFSRQDSDRPVQMLCGVQDDAAPAIAAVRAAAVQSLDVAVELVVETRSHGGNRKVSNLINMMPRARHDILVLSDSDIVVEPGYLRAVCAELAAPQVGAVTCLYHGLAVGGLWARLSALAVNAHFLPNAIAGIGLGLARPCCGATIALRRPMLDRIGGFSGLADVLADDHAIGAAIRAEGYDVIVAPFLVGHACFEATLPELLLHQLRVARTIKSIDLIAHAGTLVTHPLPFALLALALGNRAAVPAVVAALVARIALCLAIEWRFDLPRQEYWLVPLLDVLALAVYVASFFGATVRWQGACYRVAADGTLLQGQDLSGT
jgi:ceramide glucosyltransferase